jgi:hypothetical protein
VKQPDPRWRIVEPGVLELTTTRFRIIHRPDRQYPFQVLWDGHQLPNGDQLTLREAQARAAHHLEELHAMGVEV